MQERCHLQRSGTDRALSVVGPINMRGNWYVPGGSSAGECCGWWWVRRRAGRLHTDEMSVRRCTCVGTSTNHFTPAHNKKLLLSHSDCFTARS
eukprot:scaffold30176_cov131-Skeletonema_dohrnii-CCMP3373.AAC.1